jgi:ABC-type transporter MlaC component
MTNIGLGDRIRIGQCDAPAEGVAAATLRSSGTSRVAMKKASYSEKLSDYTEDGGRPNVTGCRPDPNGAMVSSKIIRGSGAYQPIQVDWRLTAQNGSYKISDIVIDGLSMAANGRSQLEGVVERNGGRPQAILAVMRQQIAGASFR